MYNVHTVRLVKALS